MASSIYSRAQRLGQKEARALQLRGADPYLPALELQVPQSEIRGESALGLLTIPIEHIVGTRSAARRNSFSPSFYPLLKDKSEFAAKWSALANIHLSEGIRDPLEVVEYLHSYYVVEGHKRLSVLRYFGAIEVQANVTRLLPYRRDTEESRVYFEYVDFFSVTRIPFLYFSHSGEYRQLLALLGTGEGERWDEERRRCFTADCIRFRSVYRELGLPLSWEKALLRYLEVYGYDYLQSRSPAELQQDLRHIDPELRRRQEDESPALIQEPEDVPPSSSLLKRIIRPESKQLKVAFLHDKSATDSYWTYAHERGRVHVAEAFRGRVETCSVFDLLQQDAEAVLRQAAESGCDMVFTTTPRLLKATLAAAAKYPEVKFLNCSLNISHPILRTYYGRMYEAKFLTGVIAGALSPNGRIGYVCNYPIYGMPASINAFALGAQMANPDARVFLEWSTVPGVNIFGQFAWNNVTAVSGQDTYTPNDGRQDFGVYLHDWERPRNVARSGWNWGRFYEKIIRSVLDGSWYELDSTEEEGRAINYWWGLASGVIEADYSRAVPSQTRRLVELLREAIIRQAFHPFEGPVYDNSGRLRIPSGERLSPEAIIHMNWLAQNVVGTIPPMELLTPEAQALVEIQGILQRESEGKP